MCGRYSLFAPQGDVEARFDATFQDGYEPRYNAAPGQSLPVITAAEPDTIQRMEWGLIPAWADDRSGFEFINARAETVREKRSFAAAYDQRPCLVLADGFYEWATEGGTKQPYRVTRADQGPFAMAGLYERWQPPQRQTGLEAFGAGASVPEETGTTAIETFTILTTEPNALVGRYHDRMARVLAPDQERTWLRADPDERAELLTPYDGELAARPVSTALNDVSNDSPSVLESPKT